MSRKRKKKGTKEAESLQVELLQDPPTEESPVESTEPREPGDRWAKAVGTLKPDRPGELRRTEGGPPVPTTRPPSAPETEGEGEGPTKAQQADEAVTHVSARDHAAAGVRPAVGVRPAGEPLARARELVERGRIHEAIELYLGILTVNPSNLKAHNNLGVLFDELKQFDAALEHFEAAELLAPDNVEILANYASTLTSLAKYEQAEELLRRAQRLGPDDPRARLGIGILYFRRGLYEQAEQELGWVCSREENNGYAYYYRGEALNRMSHFDEAVVALERALELIPSDPRPYYTLGHLYDRRYQLEDAAEMYRRARQLQNS
jgi:Flp pilus assembly protein TadD